jgi:L-fuculose-phosphate aldolase
MSEARRRQLIETAIAMNRCGINQGTSGNLSTRHEDGMLITPSGMPYSTLAPDDIVTVDGDGQNHGSRLPSSEWRIHHDIYRARADADAILHAHPTDCAALACLHEPIPAFHYMVAVAGGPDIRCAPYATFGSQALSDHALEALKDRQACLMANHGLVCLAQDLDRALALAIEVEQLARMYLHCLSVGKPVILDDEEMERVIAKFESYGSRGQS